MTETKTNAKFRILIASDIHLGFDERHHEKGLHFIIFSIIYCILIQIIISNIRQ
jgi:metallophosphoesterase superfamily enzyme